MSDASLFVAAPPLTVEAAFDHIAAQSFRPTVPARIGAEVESLVTSAADRRRRLDPESLKAVLAVRDALPRRSRLSFEPGGALELSSRPAASAGECFAELEPDRRRVASALAAEGYELLGLGLDPIRLPRRVLRTPRYQAMEELFDQDGRAGRWMMSNTASVQVCVDIGLDVDGPQGIADRWDLAHRLAPVLIAAFANSPLRRGEPSMWRSTRQHVWAAIDRTRSRPVVAGHGAQGDPRESWARYALDARVMAVRGPGRWTVPRGLTFRDWINGDYHQAPTLDDLDYHLSTLFPPVRPRGSYLELRMIDAQPGPDWIAPVAFAAALFDDPLAAQRARAALEPLWHRATAADLYLRAATAALHDDALHRAATACFTAALAAQPDPALAAVLERFTDAYVARGRTRADDLVAQAA
ncbi:MULTISPECIES: ergothioneine biosynthesis glutamate--cysteine ligase EgtA [Glycomyces]|uniref:Glutamate--cysteine ligase EgtA n=2 Tax=Glycomyces TaxID=58113 RepID=A0A9X3PQM3_9ACTN|nr:ergothioneine biosynthesis glutamate--cysteine ligase EgtA [Glycomyces lechevalierae]MDA1383663.1 ergothioneine biosynthesis glutamate--cysteine ligase EgtA [Glycomyces lechevalierae]MDR7341346.1 glutamate--cysteine ligase [Glycomyces lechevalierae]